MMPAAALQVIACWLCHKRSYWLEIQRQSMGARVSGQICCFCARCWMQCS